MGKKILIIEDEPGLVVALRDRLQSEGYTVEMPRTEWRDSTLLPAIILI